MWETIKSFLADLWDDIGEFFKDVFIDLLSMLLNVIASIISVIPLPSFLTDYSVSDYIGDDIAWFLAMSSFPEAMTIIGAAYLFRFLRRILTLGIW